MIREPWHADRVTRGRACRRCDRPVSAVGLVVLAAALSIAAAACTPPAPVPGSWHPEAVPAPTAEERTRRASGELGAVSCPTATFCMTVGLDTGATTWDGREWSPLADADARPAAQAPALSCGSPRSCLAGDHHWDGSTWTFVPHPDWGSTGPAVACVAERDCIAVSYSSAQAFRWQGGVWQEMGSLPGAGFTSLSCPSASSCIAVGSPRTTADPWVAARWDGTVWHAEPLPPDPVPGSTFAQLAAVVCTPSLECVAVGNSEGVRAAPDFDGVPAPITVRRSAAGWSPVDSTALGTNVVLTAVSCPNSASCLVSGTTQRNISSPTSVAGVVAGSSVTPLPDPGMSIRDIDCVPARCFAVGTLDGFFPEMVEWDGRSWTPVPFPFPVTTVGARLNDVSCPTPTVCVSVGSDGGRYATAPYSFAVHRNGDLWTRPDDRALTDGSVRLAAVSCPTTTFCMAAGETADRSHPALRRYDGTRWSTVDLRALAIAYEPPSARRVVGALGLTDVSCPSPTSCLAVGPLYALRWDGAVWTSVLPSGAPTGWMGRAVSCSGPDQCLSTASGIQILGGLGETAVTQIDRWAGGIWARVYAGTNLSLSDVSCPRAGACVAVGMRNRPDPPLNEPVALRQVGASWRIETATGGGAGLSAVSCRGDGSCIALGNDSGGFVVAQNGATKVTVSRAGGPWAALPPPPPLDLVALSCASGTCTAVGGVTPPESDLNDPTSASLAWR
jgi:hypothetical protein